MDALWDLAALLSALVTELWRASRTDFLLVAAAGAALAGLSWWLAHFVSLNFNRQFSFRPEHYLYCGGAAAATFLFVLVFFSLRYTADVAQAIVTAWEVGIRADRTWADRTFRRAYESVADLRDSAGKSLEDFSTKPHPDSGLPTSIPTTQEFSKRKAAEVYAESAVDHFRAHHPFLSSILWAKSAIAREKIYEDMSREFGSGSPSYSAQDAIRLAGREIRAGLVRQVPRVVVLSRAALAVAFLIVQGIAFFLLIRAALADIKVRRATQPLGGR